MSLQPLPSESRTLDAANSPSWYGFSYRRLLVCVAELSCRASRQRSRQHLLRVASITSRMGSSPIQIAEEVALSVLLAKNAKTMATVGGIHVMRAQNYAFRYVRSKYGHEP